MDLIIEWSFNILPLNTSRVLVEYRGRERGGSTNFVGRTERGESALLFLLGDAHWASTLGRHIGQVGWTRKGKAGIIVEAQNWPRGVGFWRSDSFWLPTVFFEIENSTKGLYDCSPIFSWNKNKLCSKTCGRELEKELDN